ncbi:2-acylglycerol O-acyltransferase 1-like [Ptychodera flava]|uniref:2-acylglycerol O-acyltransferase 1-like n=1 Tax=Ptychodera flava TaxID=63121 RepID=UPI00396A7356
MRSLCCHSLYRQILKIECTMAKMLGIEFAPLSIPLHRRLETMAVVKYTFIFVAMGFSCLFLAAYILLFTRYYWLVLLYLAWLAYDWNTPSCGGRRIDSVRRWKVWEYFRDYFPVSLIKTADLDPAHNYILGVHPHGVMSHGAFCNFATDATGFSKKFPGITSYLITLQGQFWFPFYRDYIMLAGLVSCYKGSLEYLLNQSGSGNACAIVIGGAPEVLEAHKGSSTVCLAEKKGFIKLALKTGARLVPVYSFGECNIYDQVANPQGSFLRCLQNRIQKVCGFATPIFTGRGIFNYSFGVLPQREQIACVVGAPIHVDKVKEPTIEDINRLHETYVLALRKLFNDHKVNYALYKNNELVIL